MNDPSRDTEPHGPPVRRARTPRRAPVSAVRRLGPNEHLGDVLIAEQLRRKGTTVARVRRWKPKPPWYVRLYWESAEEERDFARWALAMIKRNTPYASARRVQNAYGWWSLDVGLHSAYMCPGTCGVEHPVDPQVRAEHEAQGRRAAALRAEVEP